MIQVFTLPLPDEIPPKQLEACLKLLNPEELARFDKMQSPGRRVEYVLGHALMKVKGGKFTSLSHCDGLVAVATAPFPIGIDLENIRAFHPDVPKKWFSKAEQEYLFAAPPDLQQRRYFEIWTLKESFLKMTGWPVSKIVAETSFTISPDQKVTGTFWSVHDASHQFALFSLPNNIILTLAYQAAAPSPIKMIPISPQHFP